MILSTKLNAYKNFICKRYKIDETQKNEKIEEKMKPCKRNRK